MNCPKCKQPMSETEVLVEDISTKMVSATCYDCQNHLCNQEHITVRGPRQN
jgi:hypothetical protein